MSDFQVSGTITNSEGKPATELLIQVMENDQGTFEDRNDDLLGRDWIKNDGTFAIKFNENQFKDRFNILERGPDLYLIIRNELGEIIHTTKVRRDVKKTQTRRLNFQISLNPELFENKVKPKDDPFSDVMDRRIEAFSSFGQRADFTDDLQSTFTLLLGTLQAWANYSSERSWRQVGYDGPLVQRHPWRKEHKPHKVKWKKE